MSVDRPTELFSATPFKVYLSLSTHLVVIYTGRPAVHLDQGITDDKVDKGSCVQLTQDEAQAIGGRVGEEDETVAGDCFVQV